MLDDDTIAAFEDENETPKWHGSNETVNLSPNRLSAWHHDLRCSMWQV
jgi:hypothetical protein